MGSTFTTAERVEILSTLLDRLCSPDLTLAESMVLRSRIFELTERDDRGTKVSFTQTAPREAANSPRCGGDRHGDSSPCCRNCAA